MKHKSDISSKWQIILGVILGIGMFILDIYTGLGWFS